MKKISKLAEAPNDIRKPFYYERARDAWEDVIKYFLKQNPSIRVLLPSYIGYSNNEGSGIFDPVKKQNCNFGFYNFKKDLSIDFLDLKRKIEENTNCLVLLVHYFGFPDERYNEISKWLESNNVHFVEDCAHALFSDFIGGVCGKRGLFSFYSLHKMVPLNTGGMLISNKGININNVENRNFPVFDFDFKTIYDKRRDNYNFLLNLLKNIEGVTLLHPALPNGVCPQTLPIRVEKNRDEIYSAMNNKGFGFVSLYHTMIKEISKNEHSEAHYLAKHITNLPVHQDVNQDYYVEMVDLLKTYL